MELILLVIGGLAVGSFLNVLIYRLNTAEKVPKFWQGRSFCPKCRHQLSWKDNIPLVSFVLLGGRCRHCQGAISWQYPVVETLTAVAFVVAWQMGGELGMLGRLGTLWIVAIFMVIFFSDLIYGLIPDEMIIFGSITVLIYNLQFSIFNQFLISNFKFQISNLWQYFLIGIISSLAFFLIVLVTRFKGMGLGDVKLAFLMGFLLGWPKAIVAFWAAFVIGGVMAVFLLLLHKTKLSAKIPLGPFLVMGTLISALWSTQLLLLLGF